MDYGTFRGLYTLLLMAIMIGIAVWAYSKRRKAAFDEAANLIFADEQNSADNKNAGAKQ
ncbi:CcoQ/FixQ family Cbb3-type cytochrome c oxidase assembly chaperone [Aeromonas diversa]|uniref:Cytochrome c oxidase, cbb3-type, CcoQ subunit n=1 Tax=Aeromonas diversa CDC 2478-85 TaxID=1268237 RepID=N9TY43_9GAMM|nr:CcoQ/FixQ family Cbb3-type cytochrome c oxidase assembly chaperone [Aeromonas diversa]ENY71044.1 cytochrome c oxidase, cbb3-type, CcoQ subunit [Aeromonas diversa CDC 2478-85]